MKTRSVVLVESELSDILLFNLIILFSRFSTLFKIIVFWFSIVLDWFIIIIYNSLILAYNAVIFTNKLALETGAIFKTDKYRFKSIIKKYNVWYIWWNG